MIYFTVFFFIFFGTFILRLEKVLKILKNYLFKVPFGNYLRYKKLMYVTFGLVLLYKYLQDKQINITVHYSRKLLRSTRNYLILYLLKRRNLISISHQNTDYFKLALKTHQILVMNHISTLLNVLF